ncbi:MAG TPA: hypothetical protein G4O14_01685 [Anaerolineae bacterium]|nr:hypothetical protein [Anaerolineae bacterium]
MKVMGKDHGPTLSPNDWLSASVLRLPWRPCTAGKLTQEGSPVNGQTSFFDHLTILIKDRNVEVLVSEVRSNKKRAIRKRGRFLLLHL